MPTKLPRHTITETSDVRSALDDVRRELGPERVDLKELVILGAQEKARRTREERTDRQKALAEFADMIRRREIHLDMEAVEEVRRTGWARPL